MESLTQGGVVPHKRDRATPDPPSKTPMKRRKFGHVGEAARHPEVRTVVAQADSFSPSYSNFGRRETRERRSPAGSGSPPRLPISGVARGHVPRPKAKLRDPHQAGQPTNPLRRRPPRRGPCATARILLIFCRARVSTSDAPLPSVCTGVLTTYSGSSHIYPIYIIYIYIASLPIACRQTPLRQHVSIPPHPRHNGFLKLPHPEQGGLHRPQLRVSHRRRPLGWWHPSCRLRLLTCVAP